jgi:hypothetical protein
MAAMIVSAAFLVTAARHTPTSRQMNSKEDCTADKGCDQQPQSEFILESLSRVVLGK